MPGCRLIVHADDFGQTRSINEGVLSAHRNGILTSASIMPTGTAFEHAIGLCRQTPSLDLGIHLTLIEETSVLKRGSISSLIGTNDHFLDCHTSFIYNYFLGKINPAEVRCELEAQIGKVLDYGIPISHLDSHQHLHMLPQIQAIVIDLAKKFNIHAIRFPREVIKLYMFREWRRLVRICQLLALNGVCALGYKNGFLTTDHFAGFFFGGQLNPSNLQMVLRHLPLWGTCELMCHPGIENDSDLRRHGRYDRSKELQALLDPKIAEMIRKTNISLVSYRDLPTYQRSRNI